MREAPSAATVDSPWLDSHEAAAYCRMAVGTIHSLVSARQIPMYGSRRCRRFRKDMLDLWLRDRSLAMRKWEEELKRTW